ncbi:MAG: extracellular solute-binding protein [Parcubacteria group bacterium]|nr:extracellular solute-binding protein [Parcubacteria group bacterium]
MTFFRSTRFVSLAVPLLLITFILTGCGGNAVAEKLATTPVTLKIWRVFDGDETFRTLMESYQALHPNVSFEYRELRLGEYEDELIRAFAEGKGPDIYSLHNTWIGAYSSLIKPMPASVTIPYSETRGTVKKEVIYTIQEEPTLSQRALKSDYVDVVAKDVIRDNKIMGLPLSVDTMALYYNEDLLDAAGIPLPPETWTDFQTQVTEIVKIGSKDEIVQAAAAIGTGKNVERSFDIVSLLMMQNGTQMTDSRGRALFGQETDSGFPAGQAMRFYTDFANPLKEVYTWNNEQRDSFDAFVSGNVAFFFGYAYHAPLIRAANGKLDFSITAMPQIEGGKTVNIANYWVETVAKSSNNSNWAWNFILFAADGDRVMSYLNAAQKPTALRGLINDQIEDNTLSVFVGQTLTAESWYKGKDAHVAENAFINLINAYLSGAEEERALADAQNKVNQTL